LRTESREQKQAEALNKGLFGSAQPKACLDLD